MCSKQKSNFICFISDFHQNQKPDVTTVFRLFETHKYGCILRLNVLNYINLHIYYRHHNEILVMNTNTNLIPSYPEVMVRSQRSISDSLINGCVTIEVRIRKSRLTIGWNNDNVHVVICTSVWREIRTLSLLVRLIYRGYSTGTVFWTMQLRSLLSETNEYIIKLHLQFSQDLSLNTNFHLFNWKLYPP